MQVIAPRQYSTCCSIVLCGSARNSNLLRPATSYECIANASSAREAATHVDTSICLEAALVDCDSLDGAEAGKLDVAVSWELEAVVSWELSTAEPSVLEVVSLRELELVVSWELPSAEASVLEVASLGELEIVDPEPLVSVSPDALDHADLGIAPASRYSTLESIIPGISSQ